jgi:WD40 repeat protein
MAWSPDGALLAAAAVGGPISLFDAAGGLRHTLPGHTLGTAALSWHPSGQRLASIGQDGQVRVWDVASGEQTQALRLAGSWGERVAYSPDGRLLAGAAGKSLRLWDESGALLHDWTDHASTIADIGWKPDSSAIAAVAYGGTTLWVPGQAEPLRRYEWKGSSLVLAWSPDMVFFATGDQDSAVHFWYVENGHDLQMWGYETKMRELAWDPTSRYLATGGGRDVVVWNCYGTKNGPEGSKPVMLGLHEAYVSGLAYQHRQASTNAPALLASIGQDGLLVLWRPSKGQRPLAQFGFNTPLCQLGWSPDDQHLAVAGEDGSVSVFQVG